METIYKLIKLQRLAKSHRVKFAGVLLSDLLNLRYLFVRFDPVIACNLRCIMCYFGNDEYRKNKKGSFNDDEIKRLAEQFFLKTLQLVIGCGAEPTLYQNFADLIKIGKSYKIPYVGFVSNGQLLTDEHIEKFISNKLDELTISLHGVRRETYETFMVNASYERLHEVLKCIDTVKERNRSSIPRLRLNYTVNPDNLDELAHFFDSYGDYNIRTLQIRPIMEIGQTGYVNKDFSKQLQQYNGIMKHLAGECKKKNIIFMATQLDEISQVKDNSSVILEAVFRHVSPLVVWRSDFNWKTESYRDYCKRIHWRRTLFRCIFSNIHTLEKRSKSLTYHVNF